MSSIASASISPLAYKKLVLHTAKYPTARVLGLLLASSSSSSSTLTIVDAIPLSRHWTSLAPIAEVALSLATTYAASQNLCIVGLYEAPELISDRAPSPQASKLAEKVATLANKDALLLLVNNATLLSGSDSSLSGYTVAANAGGRGAEAKPKALQGAQAVQLEDAAKAKELDGAVRKDSAWEKIVDFDGKYIAHIGSSGGRKCCVSNTDVLPPLTFADHRSPRGHNVGLVAKLRYQSMSSTYSVRSYHTLLTLYIPLRRPSCILRILITSQVFSSA